MLRWGAAWTLATALLLLCFRSVDWSGALGAVAAAEPRWLAAAVAANLTTVALWAAQWRLFLPPGLRIGYGRVLRITAVMAMTANSVPYLAGHATGLHLLASRGGAGYAAALSVVTLDQVSEGLAKVALLLAVALAAPLPEPLRRAALILTPAVGLLLLVTLAAAWRPRSLPRAALRLRAALPGGPARFALRWSEGLAGARRPAVLATGVGLALAMKCAEGAALVAVQASLGVEVPLTATLVVLASVSLATMLPLAPANLGVYEASAFVAYRWAGVESDAALALAVLSHLAYLAAMGGAGWAAVTLRAARSARRAPEGAGP